MSAFPMMSNSRHCQNHRLAVKNSLQNQPAIEIAKCNSPTDETYSSNSSNATKVFDRPTLSSSVSLPKTTGFAPVSKPFLARLSRENVFANINYLMGNNN